MNAIAAIVRYYLALSLLFALALPAAFAGALAFLAFRWMAGLGC